MRILIAYFLLFLTWSATAQHNPPPTTSFTITGAVRKAVTIHLEDILKLKFYPIGDVVITNHLGEKKSEAKALKGVLFKDLLAGAEIAVESPKLLSTCYFVCKANDGYTVVFSWNELFNNPTGNDIFVVVEKEGKPASAMEESILILSPKDFRTGRRHVKSLATVEVRQADK